ncbi:MAG: succinylglutamate desuccinylase/aspartoacylase family protein [Lewinellaceae bacterium]|nr:succinylglutamate desuccinylase/aspartoacylase family protein [Lewinellaceae bacterium]
MSSDRTIGVFSGDSPGPLVISTGGMHGNEPAGVLAIQRVLGLLQSASPPLSFKGKFVGLRGNVKALDLKQRYLRQDLNRLWSVQYVKELAELGKGNIQDEDEELLGLTSAIHDLIAERDWPHVYLLDLHTTSAAGDIFSVVSNRPDNVGLGLSLHAPVVKGLLYRLEGTILHYMDEVGGITAVSFESGQNEDPASVDRAEGALINCLHYAGCLTDTGFGAEYDAVLRSYSRNLPALVEVVGYHKVNPEDEFRMVPGFRNFQQVKKDEVLAYDRNGPITPGQNCRILMPRYQAQGEDGFFLVRETSGF